MKNSIILSLVFISVVLIIIISTFGDASTYVSFTEAQSMYSSGNLSKIHVVGKLNKNKNQEIIGGVNIDQQQDPTYLSIDWEDKENNFLVINKLLFYTIITLIFS